VGRHSIAYFAARQELSAAPTAASYIGRVGALAVALGIGAAVAGGGGIAHADDTGGGDTGGAGQSAPSASTASASTGTETTSTAGSAAKADEPGTKAREPGDTTPPTMQLGTRTEPDEPTVKPTADKPATEDPATLPEVVASIPEKIAETLTHQATTPSKKRTRETATTASDESPANDTTPDTYTRTLSETAAAVSDFVAPRADPEPVDAAPTVTHASAVTTLASAAAPTTAVDPGPVFHNPVVTVVSGLLSALGFPPSAGAPGGTPTAPMPIIMGVLQLVRREIENITLQLTWPLTTVSGLNQATPATSATTPSPTDEAATAYGDIGKWMLKPDGQIADYGGEPYGGRTVFEAVNVVIVDPAASSPEQARQRLDTAMFWSGFPAQPIHTTGFQGTIDDITYGQMPNLPLFGYSDNLFIFPNDHGRIFGPDPVETSTGYVWSGAFSTEQLGIVHGFLPGHTYVSSNAARNALAMRMILSGRATYGGMVPLDNAYNTGTTTTGDHDGYAVVLVLR
jgi:hypothetical protein